MRALFLAVLFSLPALAHGDDAVPLTKRGLKICVKSDAPQAVKDAANRVLAAVATQPLLATMAGMTPPTMVTDSTALMSGPVSARAFDHLVVVGLPDDPIIQAAWQREALVSEKGIYVFGFGNLRGDIGYIESDRNPFLHSSKVKATPFETEIVTLTGTTPEGVGRAVSAFLAKGLINGVVAAPNWTRAAPTLLDRNPLTPDFTLPAAPRRLGAATCIGVTSGNESEYRGMLETAAVKPLQIWRFKYYVPGVWDGSGAVTSIPEYFAGLHRTSFDNTLLVARFASAVEAAAAAQQIGTSSHWTQQKTGWNGSSVLVPRNSKANGIERPVRLWSRGDSVFISTLPGLDSTVSF